MSKVRSKRDRMRFWAQFFVYLSVFSIVGLVLLILLAALLNDANKCCGASDRQAFGAIMRSQQAFFLDHGRFATSIEELNLNLDESARYLFRLTLENSGAVSISSIDKKSGHYQILGRVEIVKDTNGKAQTQPILCQVKQPFEKLAFAPIDAKTCGQGTKKINR
jgi:hypothetical protein